MLDGIDISGWDLGIDTSKVTADFVIVKATEGVLGTVYNPSYRKMADGARSSGKLIGFYHYSNGGDPIAEANCFCDAVRDYAGDAVMALDWEGQGNRAFDSGADVNWCKRFLDRVREQFGGHPLLYTSKGICNAYDWSSVSNMYPMWGAEYAYTDYVYQGYQHDPWQSSAKWGTWGNADIHQYGFVRPYPNDGGAPKALDADLMYGDESTWRDWSGGKMARKTVNPAEEACEIHYFMCMDPRFGYSQSPRWGGDYGEDATFTSKSGHTYTIPCGSYDCSSSVITAYRLALSNTKYARCLDDATYTGDMEQVFVASGLFQARLTPAKRGDIYLAAEKHTALCQDGGNDGVMGYDCLSEFNRNEFHAATGGRPGDQDNGESVVRAYYEDGWNTVLHYTGGLLEDVNAEYETEEGESQMLLCFVTFDGDQTEHFFDGQSFHALRFADEKKAVIDFYQKAFGITIQPKPVEFGSKDAPFGARLIDALSRGPQFKTRELFEKHPTNDSRFKAVEAKIDELAAKIDQKVL